MQRYLLFALLCSLLLSCDKNEPHTEGTTATRSVSDSLKSTSKTTPAPLNPWFDGVASMLAGQHDSGFATIRNNPSWTIYAHTMDSIAKEVDSTRLKPMRQWAEKEYASKAEKRDTLFYPFSGPDFLNATTLFPNATTYFLVALEPIGLLPDFSKKTKEKQEKYLDNMLLAMEDIYKKSYFITKKMNVQLGGEVYGVLPLIAVFLKQTEHVISDIKEVRLDTAGRMMELPYDSLSNPRKRPRGVKIAFYKKGEDKLRHLYYFSADLGDGALGAKTRFRKWMEQLGDFDSYAKSASYLMHYDEFSVIRNLILQKSILHLQDDTGIAYRFFDTSKWDVTLYGEYIAPVKDFSKYLYQKDLKQLYSKDSTKIRDLPFELGYHWGSKKNNLMLFVKK